MQRRAAVRTRRLGLAGKGAAVLFLVAGVVGAGASVSGAAGHAKVKHTVVLNGHICNKVATSRHPVAVGHAGQTVCGVSGNDVLKAAGGGIVTLVAGPGHDTLVGSKSRLAHDVMVGGTGPTTFDTGSGDDTVEATGGDQVSCSGSATVTVADDSGGQGFTEDGNCSGTSVQDAAQEWQGVVTTASATSMTITWSDANDGAQAWLDANGDPATVTFDISTAQIDMGDNSTVPAAGDQVDVTANPSDPNNLAGSTLTAVTVDGQGQDSQSSDGGGDSQGDNQGDGEGDGGGGGGGGGTWTGTPCTGGTLTGTISSDVILLGGTCTLDNAQVMGNVIAGPGTSLTVQNGTTVNGDLAAIGAASVSVTGSTVQGDVKIGGTTGALTVSNDTVSGDVDLFGNAGAVTVSTNTIGGDLNCELNTSTPTGGSNTVTGSATGQCSAL